MCPREGLDVIVGIPVRIINDDRVCRGQVDTQATCPSGEQKHELLGVRSVESAHKKNWLS